jgi:hypothetical protein
VQVQTGRAFALWPRPQVVGFYALLTGYLPHPARLTYPGWVQLLPLMERRMAERGMPPLSETERNEILVYLKAHAR